MIKLTRHVVNFHNIEELCRNDDNSFNSSVSDLSMLCEMNDENNMLLKEESKLLNNFDPRVGFYSSMMSIFPFELNCQLTRNEIKQEEYLGNIHNDFFGHQSSQQNIDNFVKHKNILLTKDLSTTNKKSNSPDPDHKIVTLTKAKASKCCAVSNVKIGTPVFNTPPIRTPDSDIENGKISPCSNESKKNGDRRNRRIYKDYELDKMEQVFVKCGGYPGRDIICQLSQDLKIAEERVRNWFQNRRAKSKKTAKNGQKSPLKSIPTNSTNVFSKNEFHSTTGNIIKDRMAYNMASYY